MVATCGAVVVAGRVGIPGHKLVGTFREGVGEEHVFLLLWPVRCLGPLSATRRGLVVTPGLALVPLVPLGATLRLAALSQLMVAEQGILA